SLSPVPQHANPFNATERRLKAAAQLAKNDLQPMSELLAKGKSTGDNLAAGLRAIIARDDRAFGGHEGILAGAATKERLAAAYGAEHCWSVSRLEEYAYCPFRFFARNVLKLEPLAELTLQTDYGRRGLLAHEALAELHRRLNAAGTPALPSQTSPEEYARYRNETITLLQGQLAQGDPLEEAFRTIDLTLIGQWLEEYLGQHQQYEMIGGEVEEAGRPQLRPAHFEVSFGLKRRGGEQIDPLSTDKPFDLVYGEEKIRLSGRIDRIDIGLIGDQIVFNVLDYKTGRNKKLKADDIKHGLALQLPLYAMAVQELLMIDRGAAPWRVGYWYLRDSGFQSHDLPQLFQTTADGICETGDWQLLKGTLLARVVEMVRGIRTGDFPVFSRDLECTGRCEFHTVCRVGQVRAINKVWIGSGKAAKSPVTNTERSKAANEGDRGKIRAEAKQP
ncbi:MAG TPA: PD-(D/E)XK nuclease family protein, partial [Pirellulales bacterium]